MATRRNTRKRAAKKKGGRRRRSTKATPASAGYVVLLVVLVAAVAYFAVSLFDLFSPRGSREVESSVVVWNGCGVEGVGLRTAKYLRDLGLDVVDFQNAESFDYEETIVVDRSGDMGAALEVARLLRVPNVIQQIPETPLEDIVIIVGADYERFLAAS